MPSNAMRGTVSGPFYAVDSNLRPLRLQPLTHIEASVLAATEDVFELMPTSEYVLTWASRFGRDAEWHVFPR